MNRNGATMGKDRMRSFGSMDAFTRLAPSVETGWVEQFVLEQRILGVPGSRIGDSLAVVESHVIESGESAEAAFGEPQRYAEEDAPEQAERSSDRLDRGWSLGIVLGLAGMLLSTFSAQAGFSGESSLHVSVGLLVVLAMVAGSVALVLLATPVLMRALATFPIRSWVGWMLLLAGMVGALLLLPHPVGEIGVVSALALGAILLTVGLLLQLRAYLRGRVQEDPIVGPGEQPVRSRAGLVAVLVLPVATIVMVGFSWLLQAIAEQF